jgi:uncharacterized membrane protein HdeD (DUF308 family)
MDPANEAHSIFSIIFWLWFFPVSYLVHAAEEFWGGEGYTAYLYRLRGVHISRTRFVVLHLLGLTLISTGLIIAQVLHFPVFMIVIFGALIFSNGISHTVTAIWDRGYGPGLITSIAWIPLGAFAVYDMFGQISNLRLEIAAVIGIGMNAGVAILTMKGGKL